MRNTEPLREEWEIETLIQGTQFICDLRTEEGRWAARAFAYALARNKNMERLAKAILDQVGREEPC